MIWAGKMWDFMGSEYYDTPNLDNLANEGMVFRQAYALLPIVLPAGLA